MSAPDTCAPRPRRRVTTALTTVLALLIAPLTVLGLASPASAADRPFDRAFSVNTNGDILLVGNTLMTCKSGQADDCVTARNVVNSPDTNKYSNNQYTSEYVDVDGAGGMVNSSSADLDVPVGGSVLYAVLVWGGKTDGTTANASEALRGQATMQVTPRNGGAPQTHQVTVQKPADIGSATGGHYSAFADVTAIVAAAGDATYTVGDVQAMRDGTDQYAGWSLVVAVADPSAPARNLTIFNGYTNVQSSRPAVTLTVDGFLTPPAGPVKTTMGVVTFEGDMGLQGDSLQLNGTAIADATNLANNPLNSTITDRGVDRGTGGTFPRRNPAYANQLGLDADLFEVPDRVIANGATSATISLSTVQDAYFPTIVTLATDLYDPKLLGVKTVTDVDGGDVRPGDVLEYRVPVQNIGLDAAAGSRFFDAIPTGTRFVPGSIVVDGVPQTDAAGDDLARYVMTPEGHIEAFLGTGATASSGGVIPRTVDNTVQHVVTFRVTVDADATHGQELTNAAVLTYRGQTTNASASSATNAVISPVVTTPLGSNLAPDATPHILTFTPSPSGRTVTIPVLADDTDPEDDVLTIIGVTDAAGGTVTVNANGTVTYAPRDDFAGRDVFTYTITDPTGNRSTATVQVEVVNTSPEAAADTLTVPGATPVDVTATLLANDSDANGDAVVVRSAGPASAQGGTVSVVDGVVTYTARPGFKGTDTFTYVLEDARGGRDTGTATVTVVNNAPVAVADGYTTAAGTQVALSVRGNDTDRDGDPLTVQLVAGPAHGTLTLNGDGTGTYRPDGGWSGTDTFTYRVSDGTAWSAPTTVTISVNGYPVAVADTASTAHATAVAVAVLTNDTDPDGDALSVVGVGVPSHGTAVVDGGTVVYTPATGWAGSDLVLYTVRDARGLEATSTVTVTTLNAAPVTAADARSTATNSAASGIDVLANDSDVNVTAGVPGQSLRVTGAVADHGADVVVAADSTLTVTPATGFSGVVTVTYTVGDGAGGTATGTLTVTVQNGAPTAASDGPVPTPTSTSVLVDVLANDTDPNTGDVLSIVPGSVSGPVDGDGIPRGTAVIEEGEVRYTPPTGWTGTATFTYDVTDGEGGTVTGTVTVVVENAVPVAVGDAVTVAAGTVATVDVLANDTDANVPYTDQELTVTGASADQGATVVRNPDGTLSVTPATGFKGDITVTYTVSDGAGGTDTGTLTVTVGNAAPVAGPDTATTPYVTAVDVDLLDDDTDANGDTLTVVPGSITRPVDAKGVERGTVTVRDGVATYTPPAGFSGVVTFEYTVTDGTDTSVATVTITVENAPPAPRADTATTTSGGVVVIDVLGNDVDPDGGTLTLVSVVQPVSGTVAIVDNRLVYTPAPGFTGTVTITYTVSDGQGGLTTATVTLQVTAPTAAGSGLAVTGAEIGAAAVLAGLLLAAGVALVLVRRRRTTVA